MDAPTAIQSVMARCENAGLKIASWRAAVLMASFAFAACYFRFFIFPDVPMLPGVDQVMAATDGARIVAGQVPYRDFFAFIPPGSLLTYAGLIKIFGSRIWIPELVMSCLAAAVALMITLASSRIMHGLIVLLPALLFTGFILLQSTDTGHHWFSTVFVLMAMLVLFGELKLPRIAVAGAICGLAACCTQSKGATAVLGFVLFLIWKTKRDHSSIRESWKRCLLLCLAALAVFAGVNAYFIGAAGFGRWFDSLVVYPLRYFSIPEINNWRILKYDFHYHRTTSAWIAFPFLYCTVPLVYFVFLFVRHRRRKANESIEPDELLMLVALTGLAMFAAIASSPSALRLGTVSPPAMILLAWLLNAPGTLLATLRRGLGVFAVVVALAAVVATQTRRVDYLDLPAGRTAIADPAVRDEYQWLKEHTRPGQYFWGLWPLYYPFELRNPAPVEQLDTSDYTRPEHVTALVDGLEREQVPVMVMPSQGRYPLTANRPGNHLQPFATYLEIHYRITKRFANGDEVWERNPGITADPRSTDAHTLHKSMPSHPARRPQDDNPAISE
jgi:hypothetical protein